MNQLCRHILPAGRHCTQPAVHATLYCRHHQVIKRALAQVEPKPDPYGIYKPLPFVFPEDRAALQINFMLVAQALNDRSIHIQMANTFNRIFRSCEINLSRGPLTETSTKARTKKSAQDRDQDWDQNRDHDQDYAPASDPNIVQRVILTPQGEEIAEFREVLEENEAPPTHGKECPCSFCDEEYRGAPPEEHHPNCKCGLCEEPTKPQPAAREQDKIELSSRPERSEVEGPAVPQPSHEIEAGKNLDHCEGPSVLSVPSVVKHAFPQPSHQTEVKELSFPPKQNEAERPGTELSSRPKRSEVEGPALELSSRPERSEAEGPAVPQTSHEIKAAKNLGHCDGPSVVKNASPQPGPRV